MKKILLKDIVIKAGTAMEVAPSKTERSEGHFGCTIGLTKDSTGDFIYYVDPDDPELNEWFGEEGAEFQAVKNNIINFSDATLEDIPPERVLEAAKGELQQVLILGIEKNDPEGFYFCSSTSDKRDSLWLVENFKHQLMNGFADVTDAEIEDD